MFVKLEIIWSLIQEKYQEIAAEIAVIEEKVAAIAGEELQVEEDLKKTALNIQRTATEFFNQLQALLPSD